MRKTLTALFTLLLFVGAVQARTNIPLVKDTSHGGNEDDRARTAVPETAPLAYLDGNVLAIEFSEDGTAQVQISTQETEAIVFTGTFTTITAEEITIDLQSNHIGVGSYYLRVFFLNQWWKGLFDIEDTNKQPVKDTEKYFTKRTRWVEQWYTPGTEPEYSSVKIYSIGKDVVFNDTTYKEVLIDGNESGMWLREEDDKVFLRRDDFPHEIMLYDFDWTDKESIKRQYIEKGELKEEVIPITSIKEMALDDEGGWAFTDYIDVGDTKIIKGIGLICEHTKDCCLLGSVVPDDIPSMYAECRLLSFTKSYYGSSPYFLYQHRDAIHEFFSYNGTRSGVDIFFYSPWPYTLKNLRQELDSISNNVIYISSHYNSTANDSYYGKAEVKFGRLEAGDYTIRMTAVDDAGIETDNRVMELPLTVTQNPVDALCGIVPSNCNKEEEEEAFDYEHFDRNTYFPDITITQEGDSLHVTGLLFYTCCVNHYCYYEIHENSVYLEGIENSWNGTACMCHSRFTVDFKIGPFKGDKIDLHIKEMYTSEYHKTFDFTSVQFPEKEETVSTSYDLQGRPAKEMQKGILVRNGKKVIIN